MSASSESGRQSLWRREGILRSSPLASNCMSCPAEEEVVWREDETRKKESALLAARRPLDAEQRGRKPSCQRRQPF